MVGEEQFFEYKKENVINNFINGTENDSALAYALYNDCYPFLMTVSKNMSNTSL